MQLCEAFSAAKTPTLVLPDTMVVSAPMFSHALPGKVSVRIWIDAIWITRRRGGRLAFTYGVLQDGYGASRNHGRDVHACDVARKYQAARFNASNDRIMHLEGDKLSGYQVLRRDRLRQIAVRLQQVAQDVCGRVDQGLFEPPDGTLGWYELGGGTDLP